MSKTIFLIAAAALFAPATLAAPFASNSSTFPLLSGAYDLVTHRFCQPTLTVSYKADSGVGTNVVTQVSLSNSSDTESQFGTATFTQGTTKGSGKLSLTSTVTGGTTVLIKNSGAGTGTFGMPMNSQSQKGNGTFTQTTSTVSITASGDTNKYTVYYGKVSSGIVEHAVFGGLDSKGCAFDGSLSAVK